MSSSTEIDSCESPQDFVACNSHPFSTRVTMPSNDELGRKKRVIRYMEEERERGQRTQILRQEHECWVNLRSNERSQRLKYMTQEEIASLLKHEAEEMARERNISLSQEREVSYNTFRHESPPLCPETSENLLNKDMKKVSSAAVSDTYNPLEKLLEEKDRLIAQLQRENNEMALSKRDLEKKKIEYESLAQQEQEVHSMLLEEKLKHDILTKENDELTIRLQTAESSAIELRHLQSGMQAEFTRIKTETKALKEALVQREGELRTLKEIARLKTLESEKRGEELQKSASLAQELQHIFNGVREENKLLLERTRILEGEKEEEMRNMKEMEENTQTLLKENEQLQASLEKNLISEQLLETKNTQLLNRISVLDDLLKQSNSEREQCIMENKKLHHELKSAISLSKEEALSHLQTKENNAPKENIQEKLSILIAKNRELKQKIAELVHEKMSAYTELQQQIVSRQKYENLAAKEAIAAKESALEVSRKCREEVESTKKELEKCRKEASTALKDHEAVTQELQKRCTELRKQLNVFHDVQEKDDERIGLEDRKSIYDSKYGIRNTEAPWIAKMHALKKENQVLLSQLAFYENRLQDVSSQLLFEAKREILGKLEKKKVDDDEIPVEQKKLQPETGQPESAKKNTKTLIPKSKVSTGCC